MVHAPAVLYPVGRPWGLAVLAAAVWLAGALVLALWGAATAPSSLHGAALLLLLGVGGWALRAWRRMPLPLLRWDGRHWTAEGLNLAADAVPSVRLDLQTALLVRLPAARGPACWLWLQRSADPLRWQDLRRAVHAAAPQPELSPGSGALP